jgi:hypothetical protein
MDTEETTRLGIRESGIVRQEKRQTSSRRLSVRRLASSKDSARLVKLLRAELRLILWIGTGHTVPLFTSYRY